VNGCFSVFAPQRYFLATLTANKASLKKPMNKIRKVEIVFKVSSFWILFLLREAYPWGALEKVSSPKEKIFDF